MAKTEMSGHVPVLFKQAIDFLAVKPGGTYVDATLGLGGHSYEIASRIGPQGHLIGFDKDHRALELARKRLQPPDADQSRDWPRITLVHSSFADMGEHVEPNSVDGVLADLGVSSFQMDDPERGFSFRWDAPLDMRMDTTSGMTAEQVVNQFDEKTLADLIYEFGEERRSRRIARAIVRSRPIRTARQLAETISVAGRSMNSEKIHPATRTFQALRIYVNRELEDVQALLAETGAPAVLRPGGRLVVISFHSLEDRIVKDAFREGAASGRYRMLTKKPVTPEEEEVERNPRSRSAKLRAVERLS